MAKYTVGVDFGTESGRAVVVRVEDGASLAAPSTSIEMASSTSTCQ